MIIVSNATPLIGLAIIEEFEMLHKIFNEIHIATAVYEEVVTYGKDIGGAKTHVSGAKWIETVSVKDRLAVDVLLDELDSGEAETIVLAHELKADWVLMDERKGRRKLTSLGIPKIGTIGLLLKAKELGLIPMVQPKLEDLNIKGFGLSPALIQQVLNLAGEFETK